MGSDVIEEESQIGSSRAGYKAEGGGNISNVDPPPYRVMCNSIEGCGGCGAICTEG